MQNDGVGSWGWALPTESMAEKDNSGFPVPQTDPHTGATSAGQSAEQKVTLPGSVVLPWVQRLTGFVSVLHL